MTMSKMSRDKGKRGEREFAEMLREHGFQSARRGVQTACRGGLTSPDVICEELPDTHFEVKRCEVFLRSFYDQATKDAGLKEPVIAWKRNGQPWMAYLSMGHYLGLRQKISRLEAELKEALRKDE
jgi:Holliday junction resolvase